jgi:hypothetical protein
MATGKRVGALVTSRTCECAKQGKTIGFGIILTVAAVGGC